MRRDRAGVRNADGRRGSAVAAAAADRNSCSEIATGAGDAESTVAAAAADRLRNDTTRGIAVRSNRVAVRNADETGVGSAAAAAAQTAANPSAAASARADAEAAVSAAAA